MSLALRAQAHGTVAVALATVLLVAACSGETSSPGIIGAATAESSTPDTSSVSAYPTQQVETPKTAFGRAGDTTLPDGPSNGGRSIIAEPTAADLAAAGPLGDRFLGSADAPLTVYEYASMTCPHCRAFHASSFPAIKKAYIDTGKVKWVIREFPIGRSSGNAWIAVRCAPEGKWLGVYERLLAEQASWVSQEVRLDAISAVAGKAGLGRAEFDTCLANQTLIEGLNWVKERGRELGVIGTPTFFIGTKHVRQVLAPDEFRAIVEPMLSGGVVASSG
jgi:protein-disulfide isomerase